MQMEVPNPWPCPGTSDTACRCEKEKINGAHLPMHAPPLWQAMQRWHFNDSSFFQIVIRPPQKRLSSKTNVLAPNVLVSTLTVVIFPAERRVFQRGDDAEPGQRVDHFNSQLLHPLPPFEDMSIAEYNPKYLFLPEDLKNLQKP